MLTISKEKMSKSQGNFTLLKDVLKLVSAPALRLLMLQTHYRNPFDYEPERLTEATAALEHIQSSLRDMRWAASYLPPDNIAATASGEPPETVPTDVAQDVSSALESEPIDPVEQAKSRFRRSMDDDFNTATALAAIYELLSVGNRLAAKLRQTKDSVRLERIRATVIELLDVLGVELADVDDDGWQVDAVDAQAALALATELVGYHGSDVNTALKALLELRNLARQEKNWQQADQVRAGLLDLGLAIEDTPQGQRLVAKGD